MPIDRQTFFDVMASFPSGVAIVTTTTGDGTPRGLTTTAVCSVSADPPTVLVSVDLGSRTLDALRERKAFAVNFIGAGRSDLCLLFASKERDKFERVTWESGASGLPLLHEDALAWATSTMGRFGTRNASFNAGQNSASLLRPTPDTARLAYLMLAKMGG